MRIGILKQDQEKAYNTFIDSHKDATAHHTLEWRNIIQKVFGHRPFYIVAHENNKVIGALPLFEVNGAFDKRRMVSIPYSYVLKVLYRDNQTLKAMLDFARKLADNRDCLYLEIRHGYDLPESSDFKRHEYFIRSTVDISPPIEQIWKRVRKSARTATRKGERSDLKIIEGKSMYHYRAHYRLVLETRRKLGLPSFPYELFRLIYEKLCLTGKAKLYMVFFQDQFIAAEFLLFHNKTAICTIVGAKEERKIYRLRPQNFLIWNEIQDTHKKGYKIFDFGVTSPDNKGLLFFKSGWGTQNEKMSYYYFMRKNSEVPVVNTNESKLQFGRSILRKMPSMMNRVIGPLLLKQFD